MTVFVQINGIALSLPFKINHILGKVNTVGIEGNNCRLRHRIRRAFRKTCCFSKILRNHLKAFNLAFFYINFGYV